MTIEQHLRVLIGDLVLRVAHLAAENDALHAKLKELEPPTTGGHGQPSTQEHTDGTHSR